MAEYVEAPHNTIYPENRTLFLAGGITGCDNWQIDMWKKLREIPKLTVYNPRRHNFDINDSNQTNQQIKWEYQWLQKVDTILFWFDSGQIQPITLLELGRWSYTNKKIFVGVHPHYPRKNDVKIQLEMVGIHHIHSDLLGLANEIKWWLQ